MRKLTLDFIGEGSIPHRVYDLSIEDLNERKEQSKVFTSATKAMKYLGVLRNYFNTNKTPGKRIWSAKHNKYFAVRVETVRI